MSAPRAVADESSESSDGARFVPLAALFACVYFIQGIAEPTQGLIAQPVRSLLSDWGEPAAAIGTFMGIVSFPWTIKPLFGLLVDFIPLGRSPRRNWLILMSAVTAASLAWLGFRPLPSGETGWLLALLLVPTVGVAFTDVLADSLMVEHGQPHGWTGRLQSVQWTSLSAATIVAGVVGGQFSQFKQQHLGFAICAGASVVMLLLAVVWRGSSGPSPAQPPVAERAAALWGAIRSGRPLAAALFLFLWSLNPFSTTVHQLYMTKTLGLSEEFYGVTISVSAFAAMGACAAYGWYCRRFSERGLITWSIAMGVAANLVFLGLSGQKSAILVSAGFGIAYYTGTLLQLDLAARVCPPAVAGTLFALLMSLSNLGISASEIAGGWLYERWTAAWGAHVAFDLLVLVGSATTAACWLLIPSLVAAREPAASSPLPPGEGPGVRAI